MSENIYQKVERLLKKMENNPSKIDTSLVKALREAMELKSEKIVSALETATVAIDEKNKEIAELERVVQGMPDTSRYRN